MICPKCKHEQDDTVQCSACGIYFAKFHSPQATAGKPRRPRVAPTPPPGFGAGGLVVTAILTATLVFYFMRQPAAPTPGATQTSSVVVVTQRASTAPNLTQSAAAPVPARLAGALSARNPIEAARNATVFIRTGWGLGSGFIIDEDCHVITNRHVVETDGARVANEVVRDPDMQQRI